MSIEQSLSPLTPRARAGRSGSLRPAISPRAGAFLMHRHVKLRRGGDAGQLTLLTVGRSVFHAAAPGAGAERVAAYRLAFAPGTDAGGFGEAQASAGVVGIAAHFRHLNRLRNVLLHLAKVRPVQEAHAPRTSTRRRWTVRQTFTPLAFTAWKGKG